MSAPDRLDAIEARVNAATEGPWEVGRRYHIQGASRCACRPSYGPLVWEGRRDINGQVMQAHIHRRSRPLRGDDTSVYGGALPEPVVVALSTHEYVHISAEDAEFIAHARQDVPVLVAALRAVLDLHRPEPFHDEPAQRFCGHCQRTAGVWPCDTVRAVTTELEDQA